MPTISIWNELLSAVIPYLSVPNPIDAMQKDGITFGGPVAESYHRVKAMRPAPAGAMANAGITAPAAAGAAPLTSSAGANQTTPTGAVPQIPIRLKVGPALQPPVQPLTSYPAGGSIDLAQVNAVLEQLWSAGTIPNQLSASATSDAISLQDLMQLCTNVPTAADAAVGGVILTSAPVIYPSDVSLTNARVDVGIRLPVVGSQPASFDAIVHVEVPLGLAAVGNDSEPVTIKLATDQTGTQGATTTISVTRTSLIKPKSDQDKTALEAKFTTAAKALLFFLTTHYEKFSIPGQVKKLPSFPNTVIRATTAGAITRTNGPVSLAVLGLSTSSQLDGDPASLAGENLPLPPFNIRARITEQDATLAAMKFVSSGDLGAYVQRAFDRHSIPLSVHATNAFISFQNGNVTASASFVVPNACISDVNFTVSLSGPPTMSGGMMSIGSEQLNISIDTADEVICTLVWGFFSPILGLIADAVLAYISSDQIITKPIPISYSIDPLPGTEKVWTLVVQQVSAEDGVLTMLGAATLTEDTDHTFVYLRAVYVLGKEVVGPVAGAQVTLFELDDPAPAGDDVVPPPSVHTEHVTGRTEFEHDSTYQPAPDQNLGTETTDANGLATFRVITNTIGGYSVDTQVETDVQTGRIISAHTVNDIVPEAQPDFGVTITDANGNVLAARRLIVLNATGRIVGTYKNPILVPIEQSRFTGLGVLLKSRI